MKREVVEVVDGSADNRTIGELIVSQKGKSEVYTFSYDDEFVRGGYPLGADLPLQVGGCHFSRVPGAFDDTSPDRWGRTLIRRANPGVPDTPSLYLLGVSDTMRQGAIRFRKDGEFLSQTSDIPKLVNLKSLINTTLLAIDDEDPEQLRAIKELINAGTGALGGAHPKVGAVDGDGNLCLVKIAVNDDDRAMLKNEHAALTAARNSGVRSGVETTLVFNGGALIIPRFDRDGDARVPYISAMTLLGKTDHESSDLLEILNALESLSSDDEDLKEMWRRAAFGAIINNTDDHTRNHGLILRDKEWRVSPVFDINPSMSSTTHQLGIGGEFTNEGHVQALPALADMCRVDGRDAHEFVERAYDSAMSGGFSRAVKASIRGTMELVRKSVKPSVYSSAPMTGGMVTVSEYVKGDGTYVPAHSRSYPSR